MAPSLRDLQMTAAGGERRQAADEEAGDLEDVRLLDSYEDGNSDKSEGLGMKRMQVRITGMTCAACSNSVEGALRSVDGVLQASVALLQNKADVVFDPNLVKEEDIKNAIEDAGFEAEVLPEPSTIRTKPQGTLVGQFTIGGMTCAACVNSVEGILRDLPGVKRAVVALATSLGEVEYDPTKISKDDIVNAIEDAGFEGSLVQSSEQDKIILGVSGMSSELDAQLVEGVLCNMRGVKQFCFNRTSRELEVLFDPEVINSRSLVDAIESGSTGKFKLHVKNPYTRMSSKDIEESSTMFSSLYCKPVSQHSCLSHASSLPSHTFVVFFTATAMWAIQMGDWLKWAFVTVVQFVIGKRFYVAAGRALRNGSTNMDVLVALGTSASYFYSVLCTSIWEDIRCYKEASGAFPCNCFIAFPGQGWKKNIGEREIDALLIQPGDILKVLPGTKVVDVSVIGGTMNLHGSLHVQVTKVGSDTVLSQIICLVETAQMSKAPIQKFADFVASIFVPTVVAMSLLTLLGWYFGGVLGAYPEEWLPKNGNYFVFALMFSISVMASSEHPLAKAIVEYTRHFHFLDEPSTTKDAQKNSNESNYSGWLLDVSDFSALPGKGVQCFIDGKTDFDPLKREAAVVVEGLTKMGVKPVMVTGDNWRTARAVAREVGIQDVRAEVMPAGKADVIPADVGMAIGAGTDIAIEAAEYVLMRNNLEDVITAIDLSRKTFTRIRLNYVFAMAYNVIAIPIAAGVFFPWLRIELPPWASGACMALSSVSVVCSSLLLRRYRKPRLTTILEITVE
ncbi:copper-exporting ATPase [Actinidia rufa]|uniref:Copper-exporting ATPase n=1 Tax=Actinidia rufa TaxID=165716 RepID=A0A7J0G5K6_9ERIC|nr:copper-exporting ATPase [Actinidia rufa]